MTAASYFFGPAETGLSEPARAGVYPHETVQSSEQPWEQYLPEADVGRAVMALDRLAHEPAAAAPPPPKPAKPKVRLVSRSAAARVAAPMVVPRPGDARKSARPRIAIVIDDLGLNATRTRRMINLEGPLTLAFLPYGYNLSEFSSDAARRGHEVFLHLPMEPFGNENPGPNALLENLGPAEFERRMLWAFEQVEGIRGFNNHMGSRLTSNPLAMQRVMSEARKRNLLFLDSRTSGRSVAFDTAQAFGVPSEVRDIFLDHEDSAENVARQLGKTEAIARRRGQAIAIGHPYDTTFSVLKTWVRDAQERGFELVPVSVLIAERHGPLVATTGAPAVAGTAGIHTSVQHKTE